MIPTPLLILIGGDPRTSLRPAEAVRIGAGIGAWRKVRVSFYFHGPAVACLSEFPEELAGGNLLEQYLPAIPLHGGDIFVQTAAPRECFRKDLPTKELSLKELQDLLKTTTYSMNFDAAVEAPQPWPDENHDYRKRLEQIFAAETVHTW